jgi:hypothetical protein
MTEKVAEATRRWTFVVANGEGDTAEVTLNEHAHLRQLLRDGLKALYGTPTPNPDDYDLLIGGGVQANLDLTLTEAGLRDHAEVVLLPKDVSRG